MARERKNQFFLIKQSNQCQKSKKIYPEEGNGPKKNNSYLHYRARTRINVTFANLKLKYPSDKLKSGQLFTILINNPFANGGRNTNFVIDWIPAIGKYNLWWWLLAELEVLLLEDLLQQWYQWRQCYTEQPENHSSICKALWKTWTVILFHITLNIFFTSNF